MVDQFPSPGFFGEIDIYHPTLNGGQIGVVEEPLEEVDPGNAGEVLIDTTFVHVQEQNKWLNK